MMTAMRSPTTPRSEVSSPRQKFDSEMLKVYMKKLLPATLQSSAWPSSKDRDQVKLWIKEIGERVKERMLEIQPSGYKYIVLTQINENRGQGGRADLACHWEDADTVAQEVYVSDKLICICIALAIRTT
ncbi:hypothetical protein BDM02DRAFT_3113434 [Thelephora ganbajun]|uniref:Uncharacterized protein n=1 Tax=Thelephora ganbajun TaxID=370292 RepID=A0ACB6ZJ99_THEGA|nr:hypothetical protein BDM02DRAFT_3113434 [Thelephora ganbajun]